MNEKPKNKKLIGDQIAEIYAQQDKKNKGKYPVCCPFIPPMMISVSNIATPKGGKTGSVAPAYCMKNNCGIYDPVYNCCSFKRISEVVSQATAELFKILLQGGKGEGETT